MLTDTILVLLIAFFACAALCPITIPTLHRTKFGQQVQDNGSQSYLKKSGTPAMSGIMIAPAVALNYPPFPRKTPETLSVMGLMLAFGFIGLLDNFLKTHRKQSEGSRARQKFSLQFIATGVLAYRLLRTGNHDNILLPFSGSFETGILLPPGRLSVPFVFLVVLGTDSGVNFTDGLDGFCSSVTAVVALFFAAVTCRSAPGAAPVSGVVISALLGLLLFNCYPAKVFMGDIGALALGGYAVAVALALRMSLSLMLVGTVYMLEVISVTLQVGYFKATKGKRLFRMALLYHHFELGGWPETRVVMVFTICTVVLSLAAWIGLGERKGRFS